MGPRAHILEWDAKTLQVRCPYCWQTHEYDSLPVTKPKHKRSGSRGSIPCVLTEGKEYRLVYPWQLESGYGWEFDRKRYVFVTTHSMGRFCDQIHALRSEDETEDATKYKMENHSFVNAQLAINQAAISRMHTLFSLPRYDAPTCHQAWGILDRGPGYPLVIASSGASTCTHETCPQAIPSSYWTDRAIELARHLDYYLEGKSWASHAELQLLAYLVYHHTWETPAEARPWYQSGPLTEWQVSEDMFKEPEHFTPEYTLKPTITVNRPICKNCSPVIKLFKEKFPLLRVDVRPIPEYVN